VSEWLKELAWKASGRVKPPRGFESHPLRLLTGFTGKADYVKRSEALEQLSRDHHRALEAALKLRRAGSAEREQATAEFLRFWREHGALHFRVEEDVMLPGAAPEVDPADPAVVRVLTDHVEIRRRAGDLEGRRIPEMEALNELGELLNDHVRHEERVLFPMIEERLSAERLEELAQRIDEAEREAGG
jgi:hemerythrin-like domain-containing protein